MDERRRAAWAALGLGPLWTPREGARNEATRPAQAEVHPPEQAPARRPRPDGSTLDGGRPDSGLPPLVVQPAALQPSDPWPGDLRPGDPQPSDSQSGDSQSGDSQLGDLRPGDPQPGDLRPGGARPNHPQSSIPPRNPSPARPDAVAQPLVPLESLRAQVAGCPKCRLARSRTQTVFGEGDPRATWMFVGEAPGAEEDARGEPFVGQSGRLLDAMLASIGLDRARDVYIANVVKCRPPGNRNPQPDEVASCEPYLREQIALVRPALLVLMGRFAAQALLRSTESVGALRGRVHRYDAGDFQVPAVVTYHPAYLLRTPADKAKAWRDLCAARAEHARLAALRPQPARPGG